MEESRGLEPGAELESGSSREMFEVLEDGVKDILKAGGFKQP